MAKPKGGSIFLGIAQELRDLIYEHYVAVEGGYEYDFESGKLVCASQAAPRRPIDLALMLSCKQVAEEMKGFALKTNTITFSTLSPDTKRRNLGCFASYMDYFWSEVFNSLYERDWSFPAASNDKFPTVPNFDASVYQDVARRFPKFEPHLRIIQLWEAEPHLSDRWDTIEDDNYYDLIDFLSEPSRICWGEVPSLRRQAALETLKLISTRGCWSKKAWELDPVDERLTFWFPVSIDERTELRTPTPPKAPHLILYHSMYKPWSIPDDDANNDMRTGIGSRAHARQTGWYCPIDYVEQRSLKEEHFLSAASLAIRFLDSIPAQRKYIKNIVLNEDNAGIAWPECHGMGLIEFCKENPGLHIERRANMWRNVWQSEEGWHYNVRGTGMNEKCITERVACWIVEAMALVPAGMPVGSFTLVLDGSPAPQRCGEIFRRVQRDAAWQTALGESFDRGLLPALGYHEKRRFRGYTYQDFPQALRDISSGMCAAVRCNFNIGEPWDVEAIIEAHRGWGPKDWQQKWRLETRENFRLPDTGYYKTTPPLPTWWELRQERMLPRAAVEDQERPGPSQSS